MKKYKYSLKIYIILSVIFISIIIVFYSKVTNSYNVSLNDNDINVNNNSSNELYIKNNEVIIIDNIEPMTSSEGLLRGNSYKFTIDSNNLDDNNELYYGIYLNLGEDIKNKTRFLDRDIYFALFKNNKLVTSPMSFNKINNQLLFSSKFENNENYELKFWLSEDVLIGNTLYKNRSNYDVNDFKNRYFNFSLNVITGKSIIPYNSGSVTLKSDYNLGLEYSNALISRNEVLIHFSVTKKPSFLMVTNTLDNTSDTFYFEEKEDFYSYDLSIEESGKYIYYVIYSDNSKSDIGHFNVRISES